MNTTTIETNTLEIAENIDEIEIGESSYRPVFVLGDVLDEVHAALTKYVSFPDEHCAFVVTVWIAHTHFIEQFETTPRLAVLSPEPGSGKSRLLEVIKELSVNAHLSASTTASSTFRSIPTTGKITFLVDEIDTIYGKQGKGNEEIRAILNAGYRRGAQVFRTARTSNGAMYVEAFESFAPVVLAGLGTLPETVMQRSIIIAMRPRATHETVSPYRERKAGPFLRQVSAKLSTLAETLELPYDMFELPDGIADRAADVWEPLIMIADHATKLWSERIREAAVAITTNPESKLVSIGVRLLYDIRELFLEDNDVDRLTSAAIVSALTNDIMKPCWKHIPELRCMLDMSVLADILRPYGIVPKSTRISSTETPKGYKREVFEDAWLRYLPAPGIGLSATSATVTTTEVKEF